MDRLIHVGQYLFFHMSAGPIDAWWFILNVARFPFSVIEAKIGCDGAVNDN